MRMNTKRVICGLAAVMSTTLAAGTVRAEVVANLVGRVETHAEAEHTTVIVHGSAMPSFTAYRLERPSRLVVDLANGRLGQDSSHDGPIDVDSWAVGQIATAQYQTDRVKTARVMIGLKRACTYDVRPKGNDLYITITASELPPEGAAVGAAQGAAQGAIDAANERARIAEHAAADAQHKKSELELEASQADARRKQVLAQLADEEKRLVALKDARAEEERRAKKQVDGQKAEAEATRRAETARVEADTAKARAVAARGEVERLQQERAVEEQKIAELQRRAAAGGAQERKQLEQLRQDAAREQARLTALKAEAERLAAQRAIDLKKIDEAQAEARRSAEHRAQTLDDARIAADRRAAEVASLRLIEERKAQAQVEEANKLRAAAASAQRLASTEAQRVAAESAAKRAADQAKVDEARIQTLRQEGERIAKSAEAARAQVEAARLETLKLMETQGRERARLESSRLEARRLADQRQLEIERAAHASALVSGERAKIEAAEQEARRFAELRQKESARLDEVRRSAELAATRRVDELRRLDEARANQKATVAVHERELKLLAERRDRELRALAEARAGEEAKIAVARDEVARARAELAALEAQRNANKAEAERARVEVSSRKAEAERARVEVSSRKAEAERARVEVSSRKAEAERAQGELDTRRAEAERVKGELDTRRAEAERVKGELDSRRLERDGLERKIEEARAELERAKQAAAAAAKAPKPVVAAAAPLPISPQSKERARAGLPLGGAKVKDIRFADDTEAHRVIIDVQGEPDWRTTPSQHGELTLRIAGADLPRRLERTLDTAAYKGPVKSVSTYSDPSDANVVKVVVALNPGMKGGEPKVTKEGDRLVWEFPREAHATQIAPTRVGGYGASIPLQVAAATPTNLPNPNQGRRRVQYSNRRIDLDFVNFDIGNILRLLSDVGQVNIITSDDVKGTVTIRMHDVPWDQALEVILKSKGLGQQREGNLIRVAPLGVLEKEVEQEIARAKAAIELKPLETRLIPLSYAAGDKMMPRVQEILSSRGKVSVDERTNMLIVSDVASNIALAEDLIRNLDTQTPQVLIEARIVEATHNFTRQVGIQWGGNTLNSAATGNPTGLSFPSTVGLAGAGTDASSPISGLQGPAAANPNYVVNLPTPTGTGSGGGLGVVLGSLSGAYNINLRLSASESTGEVRIVSAPKITTIDNVEASIEQGTSIPISVVSAAGTNTVFVDAKLNLTVKPHITNEGSVMMIMSLTNNQPDFVNTSANGTPTILKKQARTEMLVRDGDTAVIGGIFTRNSGVSYQKLPWIADVPILGWLFKNRRENDDRSELLIFITPRIVNRQTSAR